jgi:glycosyltransferase involved in cell wall biosynthesis
VLQVSAAHVYLTYPFVLSWSLLEAITTGCTVVASNTAPVKEFLSEEPRSRLVDFFDVEELKAAAIEMLGEKTGNERGRHASSRRNRPIDSVRSALLAYQNVIGAKDTGVNEQCLLATEFQSEFCRNPATFMNSVERDNRDRNQA